MAGSPSAVTRETRQCWRVRRANSPRTWLAGVRASVVAEKRVTTVERRERRKVEVRRTERRKRKPTRVPARASRWWNQSSAIGLVDTERLTDGLGDKAKSRSLSNRVPTDWKAGCGRPACPVWREGERRCRSPYPYTPSRVASFAGVSLTECFIGNNGLRMTNQNITFTALGILCCRIQL